MLDKERQVTKIKKDANVKTVVAHYCTKQIHNHVTSTEDTEWTFTDINTTTKEQV